MELPKHTSHMVRVYNKVLPSGWCSKLIDLFETSEINHEYVNNDHRPCFTSLNLNKHHKDVVDSLIPYVQNVYDQYKTKYLPDFGFLEEFRVKRYLTNGQDRFDEHVDVMNWITARRVVSFLIYLNDNDGDTVFPNHGLNIKPECGKLVVFPPTWEYPHMGLPPKNNSKYILSTYIHLPG